LFVAFVVAVVLVGVIVGSLSQHCHLNVPSFFLFYFCLCDCDVTVFVYSCICAVCFHLWVVISS
jgi:hypothetical protein